MIFDWNKPVTRQEQGFPRDIPPLPEGNGNWVTPVNFYEGTLYFRATVSDMPTKKTMRLQFCFWQLSLGRENCGPLSTLAFEGSPVTNTWTVQVQKMWKKDGLSMDWTQPRDRVGVAIKNTQGIPVSGLEGWNWGGDNPNDWYPMELRFTVVVVEAGKSFSGWQNYP